MTELIAAAPAATNAALAVGTFMTVATPAARLEKNAAAAERAALSMSSFQNIRRVLSD